MTGIGTLDVVVFDAPDVEALAAFWTALTGWTIGRHDPHWITLESASGPFVAFQRAPDHVAPQWPGQRSPQQFHLDLDVADPAVAAERAVGLGAVRLAEGPSWVTLADPAGHPFDLCLSRSVAPMSRRWICVDAPDTTALGRFYAAVLGAEITSDDHVGTEIVADGTHVMFQPVSDYRPPRWPDPAFPQQAHLDVRVADLETGEARVLALGATRIGDGDETFRVFADPAGHPFCLVL